LHSLQYFLAGESILQESLIFNEILLLCRQKKGRSSSSRTTITSEGIQKPSQRVFQRRKESTRKQCRFPLFKPICVLRGIFSENLYCCIIKRDQCRQTPLAIQSPLASRKRSIFILLLCAPDLSIALLYLNLPVP